MPFRDKMKRAFGRSSEEENGLDKVWSKPSRKEKRQKREYADNVYKPGEIMPKPKYVAPYNKDHQAKLSAFSFGDAWKRRKSVQSQYSPRGSRLPSGVSGSRSRQPSRVDGMMEENVDGDDDVANGEYSHDIVSCVEAFTDLVQWAYRDNIRKECREISRMDSNLSRPLPVEIWIEEIRTRPSQRKNLLLH